MPIALIYHDHPHSVHRASILKLDVQGRSQKIPSSNAGHRCCRLTPSAMKSCQRQRASMSECTYARTTG